MLTLLCTKAVDVLPVVRSDSASADDGGVGVIVRCPSADRGPSATCFSNFVLVTHSPVRIRMHSCARLHYHPPGLLSEHFTSQQTTCAG